MQALIVDAQGGEYKAAYGDNLLNELSIRLTAEFGKGFDASILEFLDIRSDAALQET